MIAFLRGTHKKVTKLAPCNDRASICVLYLDEVFGICTRCNFGLLYLHCGWLYKDLTCVLYCHSYIVVHVHIVFSMLNTNLPGSSVVYIGVVVGTGG